jgi:NAD(P)-dependent dehydrogenase (short-subunit alcohol dehydrogenase family)
MKQPDFTGKVVVITGASAGVGRTLAREFAAHGATVALLARGIDGLNAAVAEAVAAGAQAKAYPVDVADAQAVDAVAETIIADFGSIDVWVNNAMISVFGEFKDIDPADFKRVTEVTYLGQVYGTQAALKHMLPKNRGNIILVGSALAHRGIPLQSAYCGSKHGIQGFFESLRAELQAQKSHIQLSMVHLPAMNTTQFAFVKSHLPNKPKPMGAIYQPEVAARAIVKVAAHPQREVMVGYPTPQTVLGNKFLPWFLDWFLGKTGYEGQQTPEPANPNRPHNLYHPLPGDHGAHGEFKGSDWAVPPGFWTVAQRTAFTGAVALAITGVVCLVKKLGK